MPERHEYEMYLRALADDLRSVTDIAAVQLSGNSITIETSLPVEVKALANEIEPYFANERFDQYRFVSLVSVP